MEFPNKENEFLIKYLQLSDGAGQRPWELLQEENYYDDFGKLVPGNLFSYDFPITRFFIKKEYPYSSY